MTDFAIDHSSHRSPGWSPFFDKLLSASGKLWFTVAAAGQLAFIWFIVMYYGQRTWAGDLSEWNEKPLITGHVPGDAAGNIMFALHVFVAAIMTFGGAVQLVPAIRKHVPVFHRWNGRIFAGTAIFLAVGGLWLVWVRGTQLSTISALAGTLNATLILAFVGLAVRFAIARDFDTHRRWAMRAFLVANGVWFMRIGMMAWVILAQGPVGMNRTLSGPMDIVISFGCYLIPLAVVELYFQAQRSSSAPLIIIATSATTLAAVITAIGAVGTVVFMWGPYI